MRERVLAKSHDEELRALKTLATGKSVEVLYTATHLREIQQIPHESYRQEHLDLLCGLGAAYLTPVTNMLVRGHPQNVWTNFLENDSQNAKSGTESIAEIQDLINRKLSGLPVEQTFSELNATLHTDLQTILEDALGHFESTLTSDIGEDQLDSMKVQIESQLSQLKNMQGLDIPDDQELGPRPFRELDQIKEVEELPAEKVIPSIEEFFRKENPDFHWSNYFNDTPENHIAVCYSLLNWAGYWADDFTSMKKGKDRFNASKNDLMHVQSGARCYLLVSNDVAFLKKADAIYKHLNIGTLPVKPGEALQYL